MPLYTRCIAMPMQRGICEAPAQSPFLGPLHVRASKSTLCTGASKGFCIALPTKVGLT